MNAKTVIALPLMACGAILSLSSCRTCRNVEAVTDTEADVRYVTRRDSVRSVVELRDSVAVRDSVTVYMKGDTVYVDRWHWRDRRTDGRRVSREVRTDTVWKERVRTVTRTRVETVAKRPPLWRRLLVVAALLAAAALAFRQVASARHK